jgi:hypothetical protein
MSPQTLIDSPLPWGIAGFVIGLALGVNTASVWLVAAGLGGFLVYLWRHGPARQDTESRLFAGGPAFMTAWLVGFVVRGLIF